MALSAQLLLFFIFSISPGGCLHVLIDGSKVTEYNSPKLAHGVQKFDVSGPVTFEEDPEGLAVCVLTESARGHIVMAGTTGLKCSFEHMVRECHSRGCLGVVFRLRRSTTAGRGVHGWWWDKGRDLVNMPPLVELSQDNWDELSDTINSYDGGSAVNSSLPANSSSTSASGITLRLTSTDVNPWERLFANPAWVFSQILLALGALVNVVLCAYKLAVKFWATRAWLAICCLALEASANLIRFIYLAVDPFYSSQLLSYPSSAVFLFLPLPLNLLAAVLVGLFWLELSDKVNRGRVMGSFITKFKYVAIGIALLMLGLELLSRLATSFFFLALHEVSSITGPLITLCSLVVTVFIIVTGARVWRLLEQGGSSSGASGSATSSSGRVSVAARGSAKPTTAYARRLVIFIVCSCACRITVLIGGVVMSLASGMGPRVFSFYLYQVALSANSSFQIAMFRHTASKTKRSGSVNNTRGTLSTRRGSRSPKASQNSPKLGVRLGNLDRVDDFELVVVEKGQGSMHEANPATQLV